MATPSCKTLFSLYQKLTQRADMVLEVLDTRSSRTSGRTVVELSLSPGVGRSYNTLFKGIGESSLDALELAALSAMPTGSSPWLPCEAWVYPLVAPRSLRGPR